ncbi:pyocin activator PrtN family protein [Pseudomonas gingeri]|uniref:pyocin activator PrtN family protein n=1 Tax=Pseudomonas gingeri TaxID=117681 RepID=UPI0015A0EFCD|nr:pyocin activator PrtN family protein [Pseudomonas gingeri]NVZ62028.1 pyocin activator PrtN family protein [Pseudomonas gingeri]
MKEANQPPLRLMPAPETATVELLYRIFGDVLIPLEKIRVQYFRNLNAERFIAAINSGRIQLPITTLDDSQKAQRYAHIKHVAALIDISAYRADEHHAKLQTDSPEQDQ